MYRNTYLLVIFLAIFAALVAGVNIGRKVDSLQTPPQPASTTAPTPIPSPVPNLLIYTNQSCGFTLQYPDTLTKLEDASGSAIFVQADSKAQAVAIACQKNMPRPPVSETNIETITLTNDLGTASISAKLYRDSSSKDGTLMDALIFRNPKNGLDIFIAGYGETFTAILKTIKILP